MTNYKNSMIVLQIKTKTKGIKNDTKKTTNIQRLDKVNVYQW